VADFASKMQPHLSGLLEAGEELRGVCAVTQQGIFRGRSLALGVTGRRLILQPLDRRGNPAGEAISMPPERIESARAQGAGGGWANVEASLMDAAAVTLKLRTTDGEKLTLSMMRGTGPLGRLGGGEGQRTGVTALAEWFDRNERSPR
jgi:hypothetical protein